MQAQESRKKTTDLKEAIEKFLEMKEHKFEYNETENKFIVERNIKSLDIIRDESFVEIVTESLENIYPQEKVSKIKEINEYKIEIYI